VFYPYNLTSWEPLAVGCWFGLVRQLTAVALIGATLVLVAMSGRPRTQSARWHELDTVLVVTLLAAPITWTHYYAVCLIPFAAYVGTFVRSTPVERCMYAGVFALNSAPVVLLLPTNPIIRALHERVLVSHYIIGGLLLLAAIVVSRRRGVVVFSEPAPTGSHA
jgi:hypothetical protein